MLHPTVFNMSSTILNKCMIMISHTQYRNYLFCVSNTPSGPYTQEPKNKPRFLFVSPCTLISHKNAVIISDYMHK